MPVTIAGAAPAMSATDEAAPAMSAAGGAALTMSTTDRTALHMETVAAAGRRIAVLAAPVCVVGSGAAGLAAFHHLQENGVEGAVLITEDWYSGTSRNTGSDKQTYYKLTLAGDAPDSVGEMAATLFAGGSMDGDLARIEAALSAECFFWLSAHGVPFPRNVYGEAVGYKTDHDPRSRATSAGPLTSRLMVECLERAVLAEPGVFLDGWQVVRLLISNDLSVEGLLCLRVPRPGVSPAIAGPVLPAGADPDWLIVCGRQVVLAGGGPAALYADSVYPGSQAGSSGLALEAGATARNLGEWQYGLASVLPRWNVSGSYQQVLPCYISTDEAGGDERDFLSDTLTNPRDRLGAIFRKGYQWPFDVRKRHGSSRIDLLVHRETALRGRRVFLDFRRNDPACPVPFDLSILDEEAASYLGRAGCTQPTPLERLSHLNQPAIDLYRSFGVSLADEPLEIRVCAQHHNGGLAVDSDWSTDVAGLYAIGEAAGTHGVYRPGGSALNSGQVGAWRAADAICRRLRAKGAESRDDRRLTIPDKSGENCRVQDFSEGVPANVIRQAEERIVWLSNPDHLPEQVSRRWTEGCAMMSRIAGPMRDPQGMRDLLRRTEQELVLQDKTLRQNGTDRIRKPSENTPSSVGNVGVSQTVAASAQPRSASASMLARWRDLLLTRRACLTAMLDLTGSLTYPGRGSALIAPTGSDGEAVDGDHAPAVDRDDSETIPAADKIQEIRQVPVNSDLSSIASNRSDEAQEIRQQHVNNAGLPELQVIWRPVRPLPKPDDVFETVWRAWRAEHAVHDADRGVCR